jgi:hypothetical protein
MHRVQISVNLHRCPLPLLRAGEELLMSARWWGCNILGLRIGNSNVQAVSAHLAAKQGCQFSQLCRRAHSTLQ